MKHHKFADIFPMLEGDEFQKLVDDIRENGLLEPITLYDGEILDGRNRYRACIEAGVEPRFVDIPAGVDPLTFVVSKNLNRRHLSTTQKAAIGLQLLPYFEEKAKERQGTRSDITPNLAESEKREAVEEVSDIVNVSTGTLKDAKRIKEQAPDIFDKMVYEDTPVYKAANELRKQLRVEELETVPDLPDKKYRVIYADPPYSTMSKSELSDLPVVDLVEDDAVLFMWVTSPLLAQCFELIEAWGFSYKACFVWDKVKHNFGHYNSIRHEFLLICTRGSCTPDNPEQIDSVVSIEKSAKHSEKPEQFRKIIDNMYPNGMRIELFAHTETDGWDSWGNEATNPDEPKTAA